MARNMRLVGYCRFQLTAYVREQGAALVFPEASLTKVKNARQFGNVPDTTNGTET